MRRTQQFLNSRLVSAFTVALFMLAPVVFAQNSSDNPIPVTPAASAGYSYSHLHYHILPANTPAGQVALAARTFTSPSATARPTPLVASVPAPGFYPDDLDYFGGPVVKSLRSHPVYLNAASCGGVAKCWEILRCS